MIQVNRIYLIFNRLVTKKFLVDTSEKEFEKKALIDALKSIGAQASGNMKEETLLAKVAELDEESTAKLKEALGIEA